MPLPTGGTVVMRTGKPSRPPKPAYLVRFPEDVWTQLEAASQSGQLVNLSFDDGMNLHIPGTPHPIHLDIQNLGTCSEIYSLSSTKPTLEPYALASTRLSVPISSASTSRAADKLRAQNQAFDKKKKDRADRVNGVKKPPSPLPTEPPVAETMARAGSNPFSTMAGIGTGQTGQIIPLKTRVVQLLALGPLSVDEIVRRVGMSDVEVMRVVKVVGRETSPGTYTLLPSKYSQVKITAWKYTHAEKMLVIQLAREAFDTLGLDPDAHERVELDKKEDEVMNGGASGSGGSVSGSDETGNQHTAPSTPTVQQRDGLTNGSGKKDKDATGAGKKERGSGKKQALGLIGKQKAKFAAEKRAASLPNVRKVESTRPRSSPRIADPTASQESPIKAEPSAKTKRKAFKDVPNNPPPSKRVSSPGSAHSSEESRGRFRERPVKSLKLPNGNRPNIKHSRSYSSSGSSDEELLQKQRPLSAPMQPREDVWSKPITKRKPPTPELKLDGHATIVQPHKEPMPDPEALRERYEELSPAYQLLTKKLAKLHRAAEQGEGEEGEVGSLGMDQSEVTKLVTRWEKWHRELEGIRRWFSG